MNYVVSALFCEHIRQEAGGLDTLIGVMPDSLMVPNFPGALQGLGIYFRINFNWNTKIDQMTLTIVGTDESILASQDIEQQLIQQAVKEAKQVGASFASIISRMMFSGIPILNPGRLSAKIKINDDEWICGSLGVMQQEPS